MKVLEAGGKSLHVTYYSLDSFVLSMCVYAHFPFEEDHLLFLSYSHIAFHFLCPQNSIFQDLFCSLFALLFHFPCHDISWRYTEMETPEEERGTTICVPSFLFFNPNAWTISAFHVLLSFSVCDSSDATCLFDFSGISGYYCRMNVGTTDLPNFTQLSTENLFILTMMGLI